MKMSLHVINCGYFDDNELIIISFSGFASPTQRPLEKSTVAPSNFTIKVQDAYERLLSFFKPVSKCHLITAALFSLLASLPSASLPVHSPSFTVSIFKTLNLIL